MRPDARIPCSERSTRPLRSVVVAITSYGIAGRTTMTHLTISQPDSLSEGAVTLRPWHEDFAPSLEERINDRAVAEFMDTVPQPYSLADAHEFIERSRQGWLTGDTTTFAIFVDGIEGATGGLGVHWNEREHGVAEVGYWVAAEARGRGVATAATEARRALGVRGRVRSRTAATPRRRAEHRVEPRRREGRLHPRGRPALEPLQRAPRTPRRLRHGHCSGTNFELDPVDHSGAVVANDEPTSGLFRDHGERVDEARREDRHTTVEADANELASVRV